MRQVRNLKEYFYFKKHERRGLIILSFLSLFALIIPYFYPYFFDKHVNDFSKIELIAAQFYEGQRTDDAVYSSNSKEQKAELFLFNPNRASAEEFRKLGLSERTTNSIINYRNKGGQFYKKADFKKIYTLSEEDYRRLSNYIDLPELASKTKKKITKSFTYDHPDKVIIQEFDFDPNTASYEDLVRLGIPSRTAKGLVNYRNAGAVFKKKSDLKKVYNFSEEDYTRLEKHILLPDVHTFKKEEKLDKKEKNQEKILIDINTASVEEWQELYGIGPSYSRRIVKQRNKMGGFGSIEQVAEVYKLPDSVFQSIKPFLRFNSPPTKIAINHISEDALKAKGLMRYKEASRIIAYRKQHGPFVGIDDFRKMPVFKEEFFQKLEPYLSFE